MFWALMLVVTLKYVMLILRADNRGEGGGLALTALAAQAVSSQPRLRHALLLLGVLGATLFYGDSVITPAISVLGAMEGLQVVAPALERYVVPASAGDPGRRCSRCSASAPRTVGRLFGPVIVLWFVVLAGTGAWHIVQQPAILAALEPAAGRHFLADRGWQVWLAVGAIVLALTGAEALYADMGHFGRRPIQLAWTRPGAAVAGAQLHGPGRAADARPGGDREPVLSPVSRGVAGPGAGAGHAGGDHRVAGGDLRRLLADAAGDPARLPATHERCATPRRAQPGRSTCRRSTGCCWPAWWRRCSASAARRRWPAPTASR